MAVNMISTTLTSENASHPDIISIFRGDLVKVVFKFTSDDYPVKKIRILDGTLYGVEVDVDDPVDGEYTVEAIIQALHNKAHYELIDDRDVVVHYGVLTIDYLDYYEPDFYVYYNEPTYSDSSYTGYIGHTTVYIHAAWWSGEYQTVNGKVRNALTIRALYRDVTNNSSWSEPVYLKNLSQNIPGGTYQASFSISDMPYGHAFAVRVYVEDTLFGAHQEDIDIVSSALFDWNNENFTFNIPVNCEDNVTLALGKGISGAANIDGGKQLFTYDIEGNLYVGLGNYTQEWGTTYICGDKIQFLSNEDGITLDMKKLWQLNSAVSNSFNLDVTTSLTGGGTIPNVTPSCTAILRGNNLYIRFRCVSNSGPITSSTGDLSDVYLATLTIDHKGRIASLDDVNTSISTSGTLAGLELRTEVLGQGSVKFDVYMTSNTQGATSVVYTTFNVPVTLNLNYY